MATVVLTPQLAELEVGAARRFEAVMLDSAGNVLTDRAVAWSSSDPAVATVDTTGLVTALVPGSTSITAMSEGIAGSASLTAAAVAVPVASVVVQPADALLEVGQTLLKLALRHDSYSREFIPVPGQTFTDSGSGVCH